MHRISPDVTEAGRRLSPCLNSFGRLDFPYLLLRWNDPHTAYDGTMIMDLKKVMDERYAGIAAA
jgi:hypothetical protein